MFKLVYIKWNLRDGYPNEYRKFLHFFLMNLLVIAVGPCVFTKTDRKTQLVGSEWAQHLSYHARMQSLTQCTVSLITAEVIVHHTKLPDAADSIADHDDFTNEDIRLQMHVSISPNRLLSVGYKHKLVSLCSSMLPAQMWFVSAWSRQLSFTQRTDPSTFNDEVHLKKKWKNFLYSFCSPSLKFNFMYTNLNTFFYKFIMAEENSGHPKPRQDSSGW